MKRYLAELTGTFALVFCGTGSIIFNEQTNGVIGNAGIAIAFGGIVMVMIYVFGNVSGAHFNPAVTLGFTVSGRFPVNQVFPYITSQLAGAFIASLLLKYLFPGNESLGLTHPSGSFTQSFALEIFLTLILMLVIFIVSSGSKETGKIAGLAIGTTIFLEALLAGPICGASMNPARSIAPAVISGRTGDLWIYILAPTTGALLAIPLWSYLNRRKTNA